MRVLTVGNMYPPHHLGGYELMWRSAVAHLRGRGHAVRVLTTDYRAPELDRGIGEDPDVHRELEWYWRDHAFPRIGLAARIGLERRNLAVLRRHLRDHRPDVVNWWAMGGMSLSLVEAVRREGIPAVGVVVDDWLVYGPKVDAWQRALARMGAAAPLCARLVGLPGRVELDAAAGWVLVSDAVRRHARDAGLRLPRSEIANAGVEADRFPPAPERPWEEALLYVGRLDRRKGVHVAIEAVASRPAATLTIVGSGDDDYRRALGELVGRLSLGARVRFERRARAELAAAYAAADAVLFPSLWDEPWGLVPLEAMAAGRPVIATGRGGSGEYLRDGANCLVYEPAEDPAALAAAVGRLADDPSLRRDLREGGFETARRLTEDAFNSAVERALARAI